MGHLRIHFLLCITFLLVFFTSGEAETISSTESQKIQNLRAFAKLYGYVKYFHPSDEASAIDWGIFAIYGAKQVKDVKDTEVLKTALEELFLPIAPTIQIYTSDQKPEDPMKHVPDDTTGLKLVAWQHQGLGLGPYTPWAGFGHYKSVRLNRNSGGLLMQSVDATKYRGKEIKLKAFVRTNVTGPGNQAGLRLQVYREGGRKGLVDKMDGRPITSKDWQAYEIVGKVADDATEIFFGCHLKGIGEVWADEFQLFVKDKGNEWESVRIENPGFEGDLREWWWPLNSAYQYDAVAEKPYKGKKCLLIEGKSVSELLFEEHPKMGEVVNKPLDSELFCQIPLALYSDENHTLGKNEKYPFPKLLEKLEAVAVGKLTANDEDVRLADVVVAWNVFQHFYPYFDVVNVDWDSELTNALRKAMTDKNERDFYYTLSRLIAKLQDGHGGVKHEIENKWAGLPFRVDWIENQVVITACKEPTKVKIGDFILSVDGTKAEQTLLDAEEYISGSPQWRRYVALRRFGYGDRGTKANLVIKRGNQTFEIEVQRNYIVHVRPPVSESKRPKIEAIQDDILYVDLTRAKMTERKERINDLANAKGVIFDMRAYPADDITDVICNLLREKDTSDAWLRIPQIIYPDLENVVGYRTFAWKLEHKKPRIKGKVVFLTDARAISAAESYLSFVEHYKLCEIVGQPTAGTNGNVNRFRLLGGFTVRWTGMKVLKHDGSQHHLIGIQPTVPVQRTIQGVIEGRDEFLEKALEIINEK